jgi:hypothetical protein
MAPAGRPAADIEVTVRKPVTGHDGH